MCGIFCRIFNANVCEIEDIKNVKSEFDFCKDYVLHRGPDSFAEKIEQLSSKWTGHFVGSVLWTQGQNVFSQPSIDDDGNILLWNGDIFSEPLSSGDVSDSEIVLQSLKTSTSIVSTLQEIQGPFSFIYYQKSSNLLYFGRDRIGRHSLLVKVNHPSESLVITSVASKHLEDVIELPAIGIFVMDLNNAMTKIICYPWTKPNDHFSFTLQELKDSIKLNIEVEVSELCERMVYLDIPDDLSSKYSKATNNTKDFQEIMDQLLLQNEICQKVEKLIYLLHKSIERRIRKKPDFCKECMKLRLEDKPVTCNHAKIGIPFSGGLDSAIIAAIADKYVSREESIDLINVAFERTEGSDYNVPDRITGRKTYNELLQICPYRRWNFIEVNVSRKELEYHRLEHISNLIYPLNTILDESIGCSVWFASRAKGVLLSQNVPYTSPCRILLFGMGADELFGGYMRHRKTLKYRGWAALSEELDHEILQIYKRNLGRDDRVSADHGRQARFPYLDENVVEYAQKLKPWDRCYPTEEMPCGLGDKLLLRLVARKLNLNDAANFPKRAFQFGSRIANGKENAKDISNRL